MRRYLKVIALFSVLLAFVLFSIWVWRGSFDEKERMVGALQRVYELKHSDQELQLQIHRSVTQVNNDAITAALRSVRRSAEALREEAQNVSAGESVALLNAVDAKLRQRALLVERYKSYHAVMKNSIALIAMQYDKRLKGDPETAFIDAAMMVTIQKLLLGYYSEALTMEAPRPIKVKKGMGRPEMLLAHLNIVYGYQQKLDALNKGLEDTGVEEELSALVGMFEAGISRQEEGVMQTMALLIGSAILFLIVGMIAYYQEARARFLADALKRELQQFVDALNESAIVSKSDRKGTITFVNDKFCQISGYTTEELIGQPHSIIRHPDMRSEVFAQMWRTIQEKRIFKATIKNRRKDGEPYYVDSVIIPILDLEGEIVEYLGVRHEVTPLVEARDRAQAAERAKDAFFSNMSHELRTPLNAILGFSRMLYGKNRDERERVQLQSIVESSGHLLELINDILDLSKIQSGKFAIAPEPFHLQQALFSFISRFDAQVKQQRVTFHHGFDNTLDRNVEGDWVRIAQVLTNLLSNAIKFTPEGGRVNLEARFDDGNFVAVVEDSGIGMSPEVQARIFEPFEQADSSTTRRFGGTGLGLSITLQLVEMMHGALELQSKEGSGSRFTVRLPLRSLETEQLCEEDTAQCHDGTLKGRVLVAEDNKTNQLLIGMMLEDFGVEYAIASDGAEAVRMFDEGEYDLVLMDENMPNMNGIEAMQRIRTADTSQTPIVALTANVMQGDRERFLEAGMDAFVGKPIDEEEFYGVLVRYLKK